MNHSRDLGQMDYGEPRRLVDMGIDAVEGCRTMSSAYRMMARGGENSWFNRWIVGGLWCVDVDLYQ